MARLALIGCLVTAFCLTFVDEPLARWVAAHETHAHVWSDILHVLEYAFGLEPWRWIGVTVLVAGVLATQLFWRAHRAGWLLVASTHLLATNLMWWGKVLLGRLRPSDWHGGPTFFQGGSSFPSGHVVLFASIVLPLVVLYPRARWLVAVPVFAMVARVMVNAHFASDVCAGLALSAATTWLCARVVRRSQRPGGAR